MPSRAYTRGSALGHQQPEGGGLPLAGLPLQDHVPVRPTEQVAKQPGAIPLRLALPQQIFLQPDQRARPFPRKGPAVGLLIEHTGREEEIAKIPLPVVRAIQDVPLLDQCLAPSRSRKSTTARCCPVRCVRASDTSLTERMLHAGEVVGRLQGRLVLPHVLFTQQKATDARPVAGPDLGWNPLDVSGGPLSGQRSCYADAVQRLLSSQAPQTSGEGQSRRPAFDQAVLRTHSQPELPCTRHPAGNAACTTAQALRRAVRNFSSRAVLPRVTGLAQKDLAGAVEPEPLQQQLNDHARGLKQQHREPHRMFAGSEQRRLARFLCEKAGQGGTNLRGRGRPGWRQLIQAAGDGVEAGLQVRCLVPGGKRKLLDIPPGPSSGIPLHSVLEAAGFPQAQSDLPAVSSSLRPE